MTRYTLVGALVLCACRPDLSQDTWLITSSRVLGVKSEPAEAKPGTSPVFSALLASPSNTDLAALIHWRFCSAPKSPSEDNVVSSACLDASSLVDAGAGPSIVAAIPRDACSLFGPSSPPGSFRPRDPDETGGYYQPLRLDVSGADPTFHLVRVRCDLADASFDIATEFAAAYVANSNPHLLPLAASMDGQSVTLDAVPTGARIELRVSWSAADVESYAYFDRSTQTIATKREAMRVAWFASSGSLATESTGRNEAESATTTTNVWSAPSYPGTTRLWLVLRDSRGGVDFATYELTVTL
jgi:hypothetical protein